MQHTLGKNIKGKLEVRELKRKIKSGGKEERDEVVTESDVPLG